MIRTGRWLFRHRTITPGPLALAVLLLPAGAQQGSVAIVAVGVLLVVLGETIRLWGVRHIGAISRTRSERLGPLVRSGPFAVVRNPLYVGNIALWAGFAVSARLLWLAPVFVAILAFEYHAIVRWEEGLLAERLGDQYRAYAAQVPRWIPRTINPTYHREPLATRPPTADGDRQGPSMGRTDVFSWRETLYSERGTLIAIAIAYGLLYIKVRF